MRPRILGRGEIVMSQATIAPPDIKTLADLRQRLGGIPLERIWFHPAPGTATEKDVIEAEARRTVCASWLTAPWWRKRWGSTSRDWLSSSHS